MATSCWPPSVREVPVAPAQAMEVWYRASTAFQSVHSWIWLVRAAAAPNETCGGACRLVCVRGPSGRCWGLWVKEAAGAP